MPRERNDDYNRIAKDISKKCDHGKWKLFIIATEGDKIEYLYFKELQKEKAEDFKARNIHVEHIDRPEDKKNYSDPKSVYETIKHCVEKIQNEYNIQEYDEFWLIIDTDDFDNRQNIITNLFAECQNQDNHYQLGLINPCFELWLILHFTKITNSVKQITNGRIDNLKTIENYLEFFTIRKRPQECKNLLSVIHNNEHQPFYKKLISYIPQALENSNNLKICDLNDYPQTLCSNIHILINKIV